MIDAPDANAGPSLADLRFPCSDVSRRCVAVLAEAASLLRCRLVELGRVFSDHPIRIESRQNGRDRSLRHAYPLCRHAAAVAAIIKRDDLVLQNLVERA